MAITTTATEAWDGRKLAKGADGWTAERVFDVVATITSPHTVSDFTETVALAATGVPARNDEHPLSDRLKVKDLKVDRPGFMLYRITASYSIPEDGSEHRGAGSSDDPLSEPVQIKWRIGSEAEATTRDANNNPILNSAGDPFAEPASRDVASIFLTLSRYEPYYDIQRYIGYFNTTNSTTWNIPGVGTVLAGQAKCLTIQPPEAYTANSDYVPVDYDFELRKDGFALRALDQGNRAWFTIGNLNTRSELYDEQDSRISTPALLDGTGVCIKNIYRPEPGVTTAVQYPQSTPAGATLDPSRVDGTLIAMYLKYTIYPSADFNSLGL